jgi:hypothetical protein
MTRIAACLALVITLALLGCGSDRTADDVAHAYNTFAHDVAVSDFAGACRLMTADVRREIVAEGALLHAGPACDASLESTMQLLDQGDLVALDEDVDATDVTVHGDVATLKAHGKTMHLARDGGAWRIAGGP